MRQLILEDKCVERGDEKPSEDEAGPMPESRVSYTPDGGEILDYHILDAKGAAVTQLETGETYRFRYRVRFDRDFEKVKCAMFIKTKTGQELAGTVCHTYLRQILSIKAGGMVEATFTFPCLLREGIYYLNCGVTRLEEGADVFIHRIVDACSFRVLPTAGLKVAGKDMEPRGIVDLGIEGKVAQIYMGEG